MDAAGKINGGDDAIAHLCGVGKDDRVEPGGPEDRDIDHALRRIGMEMPADDRDAELRGRVMHPPDHLLVGMGVLWHREDIHHRDRLSAHGGDIMDVDEDQQ